MDLAYEGSMKVRKNGKCNKAWLSYKGSEFGHEVNERRMKTQMDIMINV